MKINAQYLELKDSYLFATVNRKMREYQAAHPEKKVIKLGIGDVTIPLCSAVTEAMHKAVDEMGCKEHFHGYGPEQGYDFLKEALQAYYGKRNVKLDADEIFISDGAKSDVGNILDIFAKENVVLIPDPVYPVYVDTNVMAGRRIVYAAATRENGFLPMPQADVQADLIYLCSPNNPTGAAYSRDQLQAWVDYANERGAVLLFDAAYESFITDGDVPHSIYEVNGAETCAIEFCSFSKTAGFTGTRCSYTVVPQALVRGSLHLNAMWLRRQTTKYNGVPYIVQRAAAAVFTEEGQKATRAAIDYYRANAAVIAAALDEAGIWYCGGKNSPYIWMQCPGGMKSWDFFDHLLEHAGVVGTPGAGFGAQGEGYFRLTGFGDAEKTRLAAQKLKEAVRVL
ncbi:MAG TPA: LL-diaminopimelate aminotransferase [Ruthenibacterium lactatiformans]|nr:LL-diaminopimelate aminotransferase [Ruthenibacterium lactatiformans]